MFDPLDQFDCLAARAASRTVGDGNIARVERLQRGYGSKQVVESGVVLGRKEFERDGSFPGVEQFYDLHQSS